MDSFERARSFFIADRSRYLVHLKSLHLYRETLACFYTEQAGSIGVLLSYPANSNGWDQSNYPHTRQVLLPAASDASAAEGLLQHVRNTFDTNWPLVFKFSDTTTRDVFTADLALQPAKTFISYTRHPDQRFASAPPAMLSGKLDRTCYDLYIANGYTREELDQAETEGAFSVACYADGIPTSACFVFRNFDDVWEIGGLRTVRAAQRRGYARAVVQTALHAIQVRGNWPRYVVEKNNVPSIQIAKTLGLRPCLYFEHFLTENQSKG